MWSISLFAKRYLYMMIYLTQLFGIAVISVHGDRYTVLFVTHTYVTTRSACLLCLPQNILESMNSYSSSGWLARHACTQ